jgi:hypothetical protein
MAPYITGAEIQRGASPAQAGKMLDAPFLASNSYGKWGEINKQNFTAMILTLGIYIGFSFAYLPCVDLSLLHSSLDDGGQ